MINYHLCGRILSHPTSTLRCVVLLAYVDESYRRDWYYIASLLVNGAQTASLTAASDKIVAKASTAHGVRPNAELHGFELFQGCGDWAGLPPRVRIGVYNQVFEAIAACEAKIILRGVHRPGLTTRYALPASPHAVVLQHLLERIDEHVFKLGAYALVVADEIDQQAKHRSDFFVYRKKGTKGYRHRRLTRIIDTLHFAPSSASRLVQAADMIAFLYRRIETHAESDPRAARANTSLWARVAPLVVHRRCWMPIRQLTHEGPAPAGPKAGSEAHAGLS